MDQDAVVLVDNRDSFTFNLAQAFQVLGATVEVVDVERVDAAGLVSRPPTLVVLGPGPRGPREGRGLVELAGTLRGRVPLLGVCLGLQALVTAAGGVVGRAARPLHGKRDRCSHDGRGLFAGLPSPLSVMRYHSLVAHTAPGFEVAARGSDGAIMALRHRGDRLDAVQFHPESIGTEGGLVMLANALAAAGGHPRPRPHAGGIPGPHTFQHHGWEDYPCATDT